MRQIRLILAGTLTCLTSIVMPHANAQPNNALIASFVSEAPKKWEEYKTAITYLQGKVKGESKVVTAGRIVSEFSWQEDIKCGDKCALYVRSTAGVDRDKGKDKKSEYDEVLGQNSQYSFRLVTKHKTQKAWLLDMLNLKQPSTPVSQNPVPLVDDVAETLTPHVRFVMGLPTGDFTKDPIGTAGLFEKATFVERQQRRVVRLDLNLANDASGISGWLIVDPDHYWCVLEYQVTVRQGLRAATYKVNCETNNVNGIPLIKRYAFTHEMGANSRGAIREYDLQLARTIPEREFTMSAFGLPEPSGVIWPTTTRWHFWGIGAGVGSFILAAFFMRLRAKRKFQAMA